MIISYRLEIGECNHGWIHGWMVHRSMVPTVPRVRIPAWDPHVHHRKPPWDDHPWMKPPVTSLAEHLELPIVIVDAIVFIKTIAL